MHGTEGFKAPDAVGCREDMLAADEAPPTEAPADVPRGDGRHPAVLRPVHLLPPYDALVGRDAALCGMNCTISTYSLLVSLIFQTVKLSLVS